MTQCNLISQPESVPTSGHLAWLLLVSGSSYLMRQPIRSWAAAQELCCVKLAWSIFFFRTPAGLSEGGWLGLTVFQLEQVCVSPCDSKESVTHPHSRGQTFVTSAWQWQLACLTFPPWKNLIIAGPSWVTCHRVLWHQVVFKGSVLGLSPTTPH